MCASGQCCTPTSCAAQGKNCGTLADGCGGQLDCGNCYGSQACNPAGYCETAGLASCDGCPGGWNQVFTEYCAYGCYSSTEAYCVLSGYNAWAGCGQCPGGYHEAASSYAPCACGGNSVLCLPD